MIRIIATYIKLARNISEFTAKSNRDVSCFCTIIPNMTLDRKVYTFRIRFS